VGRGHRYSAGKSEVCFWRHRLPRAAGVGLRRGAPAFVPRVAAPPTLHVPAPPLRQLSVPARHCLSESERQADAFALARDLADLQRDAGEIIAGQSGALYVGSSVGDSSGFPSPAKASAAVEGTMVQAAAAPDAQPEAAPALDVQTAGGAAASRCAGCGEMSGDALVLLCGHDLCLACASRALRHTAAPSGRSVRCLLCGSVTEPMEEAAGALRGGVTAVPAALDVDAAAVEDAMGQVAAALAAGGAAASRCAECALVTLPHLCLPLRLRWCCPGCLSDAPHVQTATPDALDAQTARTGVSITLISQDDIAAAHE
jgi:hypothetical protein